VQNTGFITLTRSFPTSGGRGSKENCLTQVPFLLWLPYGTGQVIIFSSSGFFFLSFFLAYSQPSQIACLPYFHIHTWYGLSANLGCRSETCCIWLTENTGHKSMEANQTLHYVWLSPGLVHYIYILEFCQVQNSLCIQVLCSPILAVLLHGTWVVGISQTAALSRACHLYSVGRPSCWVLGPHSSFFLCICQF